MRRTKDKLLSMVTFAMDINVHQISDADKDRLAMCSTEKVSYQKQLWTWVPIVFSEDGTSVG